jgi:hypothetical protein
VFSKTKHYLLAISLLACVGRPVIAQTSSYGELQAAYIYNFAKYVKWPKEGNTFVIGIYGEVEDIEILTGVLAGKKVRNKAIDLKVLENLENLSGVNIIYVPESSSKSLKALINAVGGTNILIVTEEDLIKKGAMISFVVEDDRLKFKLKESALQEIGLVAAEGLLKLAILQ